MNIRKSVKGMMDKVIKKYDDSLDHGKSHIVNVIRNVWRYVRIYKLSSIETEMLLIAAVFHDIGLTIGERENHEIVAHDVVLKDEDLKKIFNDDETMIMASCCLHHRTSKDNGNIPLLSKIIHDADNSVDIHTVVMRCIATRMGTIYDCSESSLNWVREDVMGYLDKKHGSQGYKKFYLELPGDSAKDWEDCKRVIDNREEILFELIEKYINKLKW